MVERDLDLTLMRRVGPSLYSLLGILGGLIVLIWLVGSLLVSCLTVGAYEDHMVSTVYPTKDALK